MKTFTTKANHPQTNGICERFHRTIQNECYNILFRKKIYNSIEELQIDVDEWLRRYNTTRPYSGKHCYGKTPYQTLLYSKHIANEKVIENSNNISNYENQISTATNSNVNIEN